LIFVFLGLQHDSSKTMSKKLIQFDWAFKKRLRHKANFDIFRGFSIRIIAKE